MNKKQSYLYSLIKSNDSNYALIELPAQHKKHNWFSLTCFCQMKKPTNRGRESQPKIEITKAFTSKQMPVHSMPTKPKRSATASNNRSVQITWSNIHLPLEVIKQMQGIDD